MTAHTCLRCGKPRDGQRIGRGLCSPCYSHEWCRGTLDSWPLRTRPRADVVQDVEELLAARESPELIAQRLGMTVEAIARALYRADRRDLAAVFGPAAYAAKQRRRAGAA